MGSRFSEEQIMGILREAEATTQEGQMSGLIGDLERARLELRPGAVQDSIEKFIDHFRRQVDATNMTKMPEQQARLYPKILFVILLDTLSVAAYPKLAKQNRKRFTNFIDKCAAWSDATSRVSAQQLVLYLEDRNLTDGPLYERVKGIVNGWGGWGAGGPITAAKVDPPLDDLLALIKPQQAEHNKAVQENRYGSLLYAYRNNLLHEFRAPGYGGEFPGDDQPLYESIIDNPWQLTFPVPFLRRLCLDSICGLRTLLTEQKRDPYTAYQFGSLWTRRPWS
jgi:hypothetical protein